ncbi:MAG: AAA family ATPase [Gaiellaceae bacterium]
MSQILISVVAAVGVSAFVGAVAFRIYSMRQRTRVDAARAELEAAQLRLDRERLVAERERLRSTRALRAEDDRPPEDVAPADLLPPDPPAELCRAVAAGECVLFVGAGLAAQAGYPTFSELLEAAIVRAEAQFPSDPWLTVRAQLRTGEVDLVIDALRGRMGEDGLTAIFRREVRDVEPHESPALEILAGTPFVGAITVDWSGAVVQAVSRPGSLVVSPWSISGAIEAVREGRHFVLEAAGRVRGGPLLFTGDDMRDVATSNRDYGQFIVSLVTTHSLLFMGSSVYGLDQFLGSVDSRAYGSRRHWALVPWSPDLPLWASRLRGRYGVELLPYALRDGHERATTRFARTLRATLPARQAPTPRPGRAERLEELTLQNIGPFDALHVELGKRTILLGDNGSGKSSILRALALALAGDAVRPELAARLLKTTARTGEVQLRTARDTYRTRLVRDGARVRVESEGYAPLQTNPWLALGFPPLRGVSLANPRGPTAPTGQEAPSAEDVLPLLAEGPDHRLNALKQWVVNTTLRAEEEAERPTPEAGQLKQFFDVLKDLTPGTDFEFLGIDRRTWDVILESPDGPLSFDLLSRGMTAVLGWIGVLLQRLHEVHGDIASATEGRQVLVLVDEIDVHLHPEWQHELLPLLDRHFPNLQLIGTTHSPLIVGNAGAGEVQVLRRDEGAILLSRLERPFSGWRSDQILTSPAFHMDSSRDKATAEKHAEYRGLMARGETPETNERAAQLHEELEAAMPPTEETEAGREAVALFREWLVERMSKRPAAERDKIIGEAEMYLQRLYSGSEG